MENLFFFAIAAVGFAITAYDTYNTYQNEGAAAAGKSLAIGAVISVATGGVGKIAYKTYKTYRAGKTAGNVADATKSGGRNLHAEAEAARDALAAELRTSRHPPATVIGGYSPSTGRVAAGTSKGGGRGCAENSCAEALGNPPDIQFTTATRPRTGQDIPVCINCENTFGRSAFPDPKTRYLSEGAKPQ